MALKGRPRALDGVKRQVVCALVSVGCTRRRAADYVGCSAKTLLREEQRNPEFCQEMQAARQAAMNHPHRTLFRSSSTSWRAAVWMIEQNRAESHFDEPTPMSRSFLTGSPPPVASPEVDQLLRQVGEALAETWARES